MMFWRAGIFALLLLIAAAPATSPGDLEELRSKALSEDVNVSRSALKMLVGRGADARPIMREVVKELLSRDKAKVSENVGLLADVEKYKELDAKLASQRKAAADNIAVLERDKTVKEAS